jgi:hypothetical protein
VDYNTGQEKAAPKPKAKAAAGRKRGPKGKTAAKKAEEKKGEAKTAVEPPQAEPSQPEAKESDSK